MLKPFLITIFTFLFSLHVVSAATVVSYQDFKTHHKSLIAALIELEKHTTYPNELEKEHIIQVHTYIELMEKLFAAAHAKNPNNLCYFGGWASLIEGNQCKSPWSMRDAQELVNFTPHYDSNHYCGDVTLFRCNPLLFGGGDDGKGACIKLSPNKYNDVTKICYEKTRDHIEDLYKKYTTDEDFKNKYDELASSIISFCEVRKSYKSCSYLTSALKELSQLICARKPEPVITQEVSGMAKFWKKILSLIPKRSKNQKTEQDSQQSPKPQQEIPETTPIRLKISSQNTWTTRAPSAPELTLEAADDQPEQPKPTQVTTVTEQPKPTQVATVTEQPKPIPVTQPQEPISPQAVLSSLRPVTRPNNFEETVRLQMTAAPQFSTKVSRQLPKGDPEKDGYSIYGKHWKKYGRSRTIWHIQEAGKKLVRDEVGISMGVGNISKKGGGYLPPHSSHQKGLDIDLRIVATNGRSYACHYDKAYCTIKGAKAIDHAGKTIKYSREKTMQMIENFISIDPKNIEKIIFNDSKFIGRMKAKFPSINFTSDRNGMHDNHIHVTLKK